MEASADREGGMATAVERFDACLTRQFALCHALEALADSLPYRVDTWAAVGLVDRLQPTLVRCHRFEEAVIFPVVLTTDASAQLVVERLRREHVEDRHLSLEVREAVTAFASGRAERSPDEQGYMLRCLFTSLRRHLAFDRDYILPLFLRGLDV